MGSGVRGIVGLGFSKCGRCPMKYGCPRVKGFKVSCLCLEVSILLY